MMMINDHHRIVVARRNRKIVTKVIIALIYCHVILLYIERYCPCTTTAYPLQLQSASNLLTAGDISSNCCRCYLGRCTNRCNCISTSIHRQTIQPFLPSSSSLRIKTRNDDNGDGNNQNILLLDDRRAVILSSLRSTSLALTLLRNTSSERANAAAPATTTNNSKMINYISADDAKVTHQVFFNVRISRQDGTFYVRDDDNNTTNGDDFDNRVFYGQLKFALFGQNAPNHVQRFLEYIIDPTTSSSLDDRENETPYPSYSRSSFTQYDDATGVLYGGTIPSLEVVEIQNSVALRYGNRLLPAKLWVENDVNIPKISHNTVGLLTHQQFDTTPSFGITTRKDSTILNPTNTVFGRLIMNPESEEFLQRIANLPKYSVDRRIVATTESFMGDDSMNNSGTNSNNGVLSIETIRPTTDAIYSAQRAFFRNTAKTFGDTRLNKLYDGKILRRVEVTQVGLVQ